MGALSSFYFRRKDLTKMPQKEEESGDVRVRTRILPFLLNKDDDLARTKM